MAVRILVDSTFDFTDEQLALTGIEVVRLHVNFGGEELVDGVDITPEGLSATELSERCGVDRAQISRVTGELERAGLICEAVPGEKRRYRGPLALTDTGREKAAQMNAIVAEKLAAVSAELNPYDVNVFYRVLRAVVAKLGEV